MNILVYDDVASDSKKLVNRLQKLLPSESVTPIEHDGAQGFVEVINTLQSRNATARGTKKVEIIDDTLTIDKADILIVDYDLIKAKQGLLTGENVAYVARCFSGCGLIIALNQFGDGVFDLTLRGHPESYADINIGGSQLDNPNLWGQHHSGFRPSYWPNALTAARDFDEKVKDVKKALRDGSTIANLLGIDQSAFSALSHSVAQFIGDKNTSDLRDLKVEDFIRSSGNGFRKRDVHAAGKPDIAPRVGAARISKWIETLLLPGQDVLIDAPHLALRYPSLLRNGTKKKELDAIANLPNDDDGSAFSSVIKPYRLKKTHWFSRPVWLWTKLCEELATDENLTPWKAEYFDYCFCEDTSTFERTGKCEEFVADMESPFARRFVKRLPKFEYRPAVRFAM